MIVSIRIDERLIHGQVATMWTNHLKADRIIVIDDEIVHDEMEKDVLKMAKPSSCKLSILTTRGAANRINAGKYENERVFILVKNPTTLVALLKNNLDLIEVNVGNMSSKKDSKQITKSISLTEEDIEKFEVLNKRHVELFAQMTPNDEKRNFMNLLKEV
ncbi:PTS mannose transporter subunit IIAB [Tetragenococcus osmophilus]|uniref:PTS mannose transporter subunit IIAB n=1 Tax=Tetragenococcus osmophilus TaxID=526944 RepID=A0AA37XNM1_9ENTE|nr:PTS sugar transporter subunit IIB [Tetragenococcus osmophilus]AYW47270.1 PTS mannose transporter subunit IIAB [Tetragenococcus osmophilus]GMA52796.1 PTS mannose transporter subunit IID [Alicyclobacillus contaminans]GMA73205.1 PTS mannose transporter subunit IID [Tetragenococcus osmophilus]